MAKTASPIRCKWADSNPLMAAYHDEEWGVPERDSRALWEKLMLDGFQAGLSWITVLKKREAFREAFDGFEPKRIAAYGEREIARLLANPGIIRSRAKIESTIAGAKIFLAMQAAGEDFAAFVWAFVDGKPIRNTTGVVPAKTELSEKISKELKKRGFKFVGPVIVYAWMQAVGMVNDHSDSCFRRNAKASQPREKSSRRRA
jgi:DNA-3-methyladenine glycosylase I